MPSSDGKNSSLWAAVSAAAALIVAANAFALKFTPSLFPSPNQMSVVPDEAARTAAFLTLGMRRLAADVGFVDLLLYYGEWEVGVQEWQNENGMGKFFELKDRTLRILELDPYFTYATLFSTGALAFNLDRPQEAVEILDFAAKYQPKEWKFRAYAAAIALKTKGDREGVRRELMPILDEPDCPTQLKSMLAFLNRQLGHREDAIRIYRDILNSRDANYVDVARKALADMGVPVR